MIMNNHEVRLLNHILELMCELDLQSRLVISWLWHYLTLCADTVGTFDIRKNDRKS